MKRLFTLWCAIAIILPAIAQPPMSIMPKNNLLTIKQAALDKRQETKRTPHPMAPNSVRYTTKAEVIEWTGEIYQIDFYEEMEYPEYALLITLDEGVGTLVLDFFVENKDALAGHYQTEDFEFQFTELLNDENERILSFTAAEATITAPTGRNGNVEVEATLIGNDGNTYHLIAHKDALAEPTSFVNIEATNLIVGEERLGIIPTTTILGSNEDYAAELYFWGVGDGEYTHDDLEGFLVQDKQTGIYTEIENILDATLTLSENGKKFTASILTEDLCLYTLDFSLVIPQTPEKTVELQYTQDGEIGIVDGAFQISAAPEVFQDISEDYIYTTIGIYSNQVAGTFTQEDTYVRFTQVIYFDATTREPTTTIPGFYTANVTVTEENETYLCKAELWGIDNILYKITIRAPFPVEGALDYDAKKGEINQTYIDAPLVEVNPQATNEVICKFDTKDNMTMLYFFVGDEEAETIIPVGTYPINDTKASGTVLASIGATETENNTLMLNPSLYAEYGEQGLEKFYFLVSGTVEVKNVNGEISLVVDAFNSYHLPVHIEYNVPTDLKHTQIDNMAKKIMGKDGHIYILRNGSTYTLTGTLVHSER